MFVNVPLLLKDVVKVPDLDASVDGRGDDLIVGANHKGLYLNNPLEVGRHPLDEDAVVHVPDQQLLPDPRHGQLVALGEDDVGGGVEPLDDVRHSVGQEEFLNLLISEVQHYEPIEDGGTAPLLVLAELQHQDVLLEARRIMTMTV